MRPHVDAHRVKATARGRGGEILLALAPHCREAAERGPRQHGPCPLCGGTDRCRVLGDFEESGAVYCNQCGQHNGDVFASLTWANGWTFGEALSAVAGYLGVSPDEAGAPRRRFVPPPPTSPPSQPDEGKRATLRRVWAKARPIQAGDPVELYLAGRRLDLGGAWPDCLRHHPGMLYHEGPQAFGPFPVMLARVDGPDGRPVGLHRTYLSKDGRKAPVVKPKKLMPSPTPGATRGGAVRLFPAGPVLAVAEGVETALAVQLMAGLPAWATVSAGGMEAARLPAEVREVIVCGDHDTNGRGQVAASKLAARLLEEGRRVRVAVPEQEGTDWADLWALEAEHGAGKVRP